MIDFKSIANPRFVYVPAAAGLEKESNKHFNSITTAAATNDGTFIFNTHFINQLLGFAHLKGIKVQAGKAHSSKYKSNGGPFPDEWEYVEFLIRHEFMHYTYSDFHYARIIVADIVEKANLPTPKERNALRRTERRKVARLTNFVGDYRSNYHLLQRGFHQLPLGLFSSYVNFHKQSSYMEMYELVKRELEKLPPKDEPSPTDDHSQQGNDSDGESEVDDDIEPDDEKDDAAEGGASGKTGKTSKARGRDGKPLTPEQIDKHNKRVKDILDRDIQDSLNGKIDKDDESSKSSGGSPGTGLGTPRGIDYSKIRPKYKWNDLLKKMVTETGVTIENSYQKISRRSITSSHQVVTMGAGAVKPGDIRTPNRRKLKLCVIIDSSGSMGTVIDKVMTNLDNLLIQRKSNLKLDEEFFIFMFSGSYDIFTAKPGKGGQATHIKSIKGEPGDLGVMPTTKLFSLHMAGGTVFSSELAGEAEKLASKGYNILIITDGDLLDGSNFTNFAKLYRNFKKNVWLLLDSRPTFESFVTKMKELSNNASHL
jgi:hypothetical protein